MPRIIDYPDVQRRLLPAGFVSLYHNSGAFGFAADVTPQVFGWIGPEDPTIRPAARARAIQVPEPFAPRLARLLQATWLEHLRGEAWLMPKSHWHYELHFGNRALLEPLLAAIGVDVEALRNRNSGDAIAFTTDEGDSLAAVTERLLPDLRGSDFLIAFPDRRTTCTIHHHQQLWWQTGDDAFARELKTVNDKYHPEGPGA